MDRAVFYHLADAETSGDLNAQFEAAREWCRRSGVELAGYYVDLGLSGTTAFCDRPAAVELMREAPAAAARWVLITDWRRIGVNKTVGQEAAQLLEQVGLQFRNMKSA